MVIGGGHLRFSIGTFAEGNLTCLRDIQQILFLNDSREIRPNVNTFSCYGGYVEMIRNPR
jgi:hypothetical protein